MPRNTSNRLRAAAARRVQLGVAMRVNREGMLGAERGEARDTAVAGKSTLTGQLAPARAAPRAATPVDASVDPSLDTCFATAHATQERDLAHAMGFFEAPAPVVQRRVDPWSSMVASLAPGFGQSFDGVGIHSGEAGDARARAHGAPAVTEGANIYIGSGVAPESSEARRIVAHEMTHVLQQRGGGEPGASPAAFEREAHHVGDVVAAGGRASPRLATGGAIAQGYGSYEHKALADNVHQNLAPMVGGLDGRDRPTFGGVSEAQRARQVELEATHAGVSHAPGLGPAAKAGRDAADGRVFVPGLAKMLESDPLHDGTRSLTVALRNFEVRNDTAGPYLAIDTDVKTNQEVRYDVPVSPGELTAANGDLYGSMENLRKAPVGEFVALQNLIAEEATWERNIAANPGLAKAEPDFDGKYEAATAWRKERVYAAGKDIGAKAEAAGGDDASYTDLALGNHAHFGQATAQEPTLSVRIAGGGIDAMSQGAKGNAARGNHEAWLQGHAKALVLAREAHVLKASPTAIVALDAENDRYGHESVVPATGAPAGQAQMGGHLGPTSADGKRLARSSGVMTADVKRNDAYAENAAADHFLTDAFSAGHQIVRDVIGDVTEQFVQDTGGAARLVELIATRLQEAAIKDPEQAEGEPGKFQTFSRSGRGMNKMSRRGSIVGTVQEANAKSALIDRLGEQIKDKRQLRAFGAKLVHDYYNKRGLIVHNRKGMTFLTMGDGRADQMPEATQIIALAILESRNQITEMIRDGKTSTEPFSIWDYTPDFDRTVFTQTSGRRVLTEMMSDGDYLWNMMKGHASFGAGDDGDQRRRAASVMNPDETRAALRTPADVGARPMKAGFKQRAAYVASLARDAGEKK